MTDSIPNGLEGNTKSNAKSSAKDAFVGVFDSGIGGISVLLLSFLMNGLYFMAIPRMLRMEARLHSRCKLFQGPLRILL